MRSGTCTSPRVRRPEPAGAEVEPIEAGVLVEVDFQPLAAGTLGLQRGKADELSADPLALVVGANLGIRGKGVVTTVPRRVDEADQRAVSKLAVTDPRLWRRILSPDQ